MPPAPWSWPTPPSRFPTCPTDVTALGVDFLAFSSHKMLGPTGIGVLWGRGELLAELPPFLGGGEMILDVRKDGFTPNDIPWRFEAGTPPITEAIGLGAAVDYLRAVGHGDGPGPRDLLDHLRHGHPQRTVRRRTSAIFGPPDPGDRGGVISFAYRDIHPHDISQVLDEFGVCVRAGHHCAKPLMRRLGVNATARASFGLYNDESRCRRAGAGPDRGGGVLRMSTDRYPEPCNEPGDTLRHRGAARPASGPTGAPRPRDDGGP